MRRLLICYGVTALFAVAVTGLVAAQYSALQVFAIDEATAASDVAVDDDTPEAWFVELFGSPVADGGDLVTLRQQKDAFRAAARAAGVSLTERRAFDVLWNGLSVNVPPSQLSRLRNIAGVNALYPVIRVDVAVDEDQPGNSPEMASAIKMTGADIAQSALGLTGAGITVAVMDTGVDYDHPDLGGCFGPGCRVAKGYDFVGDTFNADSSMPSYNPVPTPDDDPDDCNGHGTHVAGIVGADGGIKGVAPAVTFHAYRVFGCEGSTFSDIMLAAMERAYENGADILTMSIGSARQWPAYPTAQGSDRMVRKGMVVVAAAGNDSSQGVYGSAAPGVGSKVISVASVINTNSNHFGFTVSPDDRAVPYNQATAAPVAPKVGSGELARTGTPTTANDACAPLPAGSLAGKIALIRRGTCGFFDKSTNAQNAGAVAVVIYNNVPGIQSITVAGTPPVMIPVVSITDVDGVELNNRIAAGTVTLTWRNMTVSGPPLTNGGLIAGSSSYGPSPDLTLKPDIAAPGGTIRSTYPLERGGYANLSGTSMATPHVTGGIALLLEARPHTPPAAVRTLLQNSADPFIWSGNPPLGLTENAHRQGAGLLDIDDSILATVKIEPSKLSLGESEGGPATRTLTFANEGSADVTFTLSHAPALATRGTYTPISFFNAPSTVTFSTSTLTVPAGGTAIVDVTIEPNTGLDDRSLFGGYIVASSASGTYRVPFAGFKGDYQSIPVLVPTASNYPWLARRTGANYVNQSPGAIFTMAGGDIPYVVAHFDHQVRKLQIEVADAVTGKSWHRFVDSNFVSRNSSATAFFSYAFNGTTFAGQKTYTVPDGQYIIHLSLLKALGDDNNPTHWETWTSPTFVIDRP